MSDIDNPQRTYLGDGAYADFLGYAVRIWCDRENGEHEVFLEPDMLERLIEFAQSRGWRLAANKQLRAELAAERERCAKELKERIDTRLNRTLCEMKEGYDDSIVGFNEAWDIVREVFAAAIRKGEP